MKSTVTTNVRQITLLLAIASLLGSAPVARARSGWMLTSHSFSTNANESASGNDGLFSWVQEASGGASYVANNTELSLSDDGTASASVELIENSGDAGKNLVALFETDASASWHDSMGPATSVQSSGSLSGSLYATNWIEYSVDNIIGFASADAAGSTQVDPIL